jgi:hypothetical protein
MKNIIFALAIFASIPVYATEANYRDTKCNVYYNNRGKIFDGTPCRAWFDYSKSLYSVKVYLPHVNKWYSWGTGYPNVTKDPRWKECIRHTGTEGNQYQVCTQMSPEQLGIK